MATEDYRTENARLSQRLAELRRDHAPADWVANTLTNLVQLHLSHQNAAAAQLALLELEGLRRPGDPTVEGEYYLSAARFAAHEGEAARAVWFAERTIALCRREHMEEIHPVALLALSDSLQALGRNDEACWAQLEAIERFEQTGQWCHASAILLHLCDALGPEEEAAVLHRAVALAERAEGPAAKARALKALGRWHLSGDEYLPARRALDRALTFARADDDAADVSSCLADLAYLEAHAFHHEDAISLATEAERVAPTAFWKAYALEAREAPLDRLHRHDAARATLLEAARHFEEAGEDSSAKDARRRARAHRVHSWLHRLPTWVFRPADLSTREAAAVRVFQPLGAWIVGLMLASALLWTHLSLTLAAREERGWVLLLLMLIALYPWAAMLTLVLLVLRDRSRVHQGQ